MAQKTRYMDVYKHLKDSGFKVYSPGQKEGDCTEPYVVVKQNGSTPYPGISSVRVLYDILCYVPKDRYTLMEQYVSEVERCLKALFPMLIPTDFKTPSFYDSSVKAHMVSIQYRNSRKL